MSGQNNNNGKVKSKFFNQDLFGETNVNDVGGSTGGQVISWGVGGNKKSAPDVSNISVLDSTQMFNFVNTEVTDFVENNEYSNNNVGDNTVNTNVVNNNGGLFDGTQFANSMGGQATINNQVNVEGYTTNVEQVFAEAKFDASVVDNTVSNEFMQAAPTFTGYNADPSVIAQNNPVPTFEGQAAEVAPAYMPVPESNVIPNNEVPPVDNIVAAPVFDPFNGGAEPVTPFVQSEPAYEQPVDPNLEMQQNSPLFAMAAETQQVDTSSFEKDLKPLNVTANDGEINDDMRSNQPLSLMALSGETIDEAQKPKDVVENSKYFQNTTLEDNRLNVEEIIPVPVPSINVLAEPGRDVNVRELVQSFVGSEYNRISMSPFSFWGGLLNAFYFFYRKMYLGGIILSFINAFVIYMLFENYVIGFGLILGEFIIMGLLTNSVYLKFAKNQAIKIAATNPKLSQYELQKLCSLKGGTDVIISSILTAAILALTIFVVYDVVGKPSFLELLPEKDGSITLDKSASLDEIVEYDLPSEFVRVKTGSVPYIIEEKVWRRGKQITIKSCGFNIYLVGGDESSKEFLKNMAEKEGRYSNNGTYTTIAGEVWDTYEYDKDEYYYYYRARKFNGHIVLVTFERHANATEGMCELHFENIMNSIKEKKEK